MPIGDYCQRNVSVIDPKATLQAAAQRMVDSGVGALPVVWNEKVAGIITDRDVALAALCGDDDGEQPVVGDLLPASPPTCVHEDSALGVAAAMMRRHSVRRLPVVDEDDHLVGILTSDDVLRLVTGELEGLARAAATQSPAGPDERAPSAAELLAEGDD